MTRYILIFLFVVISSAAISQEAVTHIAVSGVFTQSLESPSAGFQIYTLEESACEPAAFAGKYRSQPNKHR